MNGPLGSVFGGTVTNSCEHVDVCRWVRKFMVTDDICEPADFGTTVEVHDYRGMDERSGLEKSGARVPAGTLSDDPGNKNH